MDYHTWVMKQRGVLNPVTNFPVLTEALHLVCSNDPEKFDLVDLLLQYTYEAGVEQGRRQAHLEDL